MVFVVRNTLLLTDFLTYARVNDSTGRRIDTVRYFSYNKILNFLTNVQICSSLKDPSKYKIIHAPRNGATMMSILLF